MEVQLRIGNINWKVIGNSGSTLFFILHLFAVAHLLHISDFAGWLPEQGRWTITSKIVKSIQEISPDWDCNNFIHILCCGWGTLIGPAVCLRPISISWWGIMLYLPSYLGSYLGWITIYRQRENFIGLGRQPQIIYYKVGQAVGKNICENQASDVVFN